MIDLLIDVKRTMRILKVFKVTIGLQKTNCLSEYLLMLKKTKNPPSYVQHVLSYIRISF